MPEEAQWLYFFLFSVQFLVAVALIAWHGVATKTDVSWPVTLIALGQAVSSLTLGIAGESIILAEVIIVSKTWYSERGNKQGVADGAAKNQSKWEEWNQRREAAEAENREFDEPPPKP